jgi:hypothetical protein
MARCAARRHRKANAIRWSRFETKIAVSIAEPPSLALGGGLHGKDRAATG